MRLVFETLLFILDILEDLVIMDRQDIVRAFELRQKIHEELEK